MLGGIDLGGTKIEARLFPDDGSETVASRRLPTPGTDFGALVEAVMAQIEWLLEQAGERDLPVGIAMPGVPDATEGDIATANLPRGPMAAALEAGLGRPVPVINDAAAFALSEAQGGAADGCAVVAGLILGTGIGAAVVRGREPVPTEVGHLGLSAATRARHELPLWPCPCGAVGCIEVYAAGPGLARIASARLGRPVEPRDLTGAGAEGVLALWADCVGDALSVLHRTHRPEAIVLGGGLSRLEGVAERLSGVLAARRMAGETLPRVMLARHGDSSGARGAALLAAGGGC